MHRKGIHINNNHITRVAKLTSGKVNCRVSIQRDLDSKDLFNVKTYQFYMFTYPVMELQRMGTKTDKTGRRSRQIHNYSWGLNTLLLVTDGLCKSRSKTKKMRWLKP